VRPLGLGLLSICLACAPRNHDVAVSEASGKSPAEAPVVTLERMACFGGCPVYRVSAAADGTVTYEGRAHVRQVGPASGRIPPERVQALVSELEREGYFSFADRYVASEPACGRYSTDSPTAITSVRWQGRTKRIEHDYGCSEAPGGLIALERRIDEILDSGRWTGR
jgi:uncharacterized protein DUF6438